MPLSGVTATEIIKDAHLFGGFGDQYNPTDGTMQTTALRFLNDLQDSFSTEEYTIFGITEGTFNLPIAPANNIFQVGPSALMSVRPVNIEKVSIVDAQNVTHRVDIIGVDQWALIAYKPASGRPEVVYIDGNVPTEGWHVWPNPSFAGDVVHCFYWTELQQFATGADVLVAPQGTAWFLKTALGMAMMAMGNKEPTQLQKDLAYDARRNMRALNRQPKVLETDLPLNYVRTFNIYTGQ